MFSSPKFSLRYIPANKEAKTEGEHQTPVHFAARNDACHSLKMLIKLGVKYKDERDYKGRTPLHLAAELGTFVMFFCARARKIFSSWFCTLPSPYHSLASPNFGLQTLQLQIPFSLPMISLSLCLSAPQMMPPGFEKLAECRSDSTL